MAEVPETFIDAFGEISLKHGMIRIELVSLSGPEPRVTQRLITTLQAFTQMLQAQNGMFEQLEKAGVIRGTSSIQPDPPLNNPSGPEEIVGLAYDRNDTNPATPTTLFDIDFATNSDTFST